MNLKYVSGIPHNLLRLLSTNGLCKTTSKVCPSYAGRRPKPAMLRLHIYSFNFP